MRTWTSDDKLSSSCLSSSARYAKAETGLLTPGVLHTGGLRVLREREITTFLNAVHRNMFPGCARARRSKVIITIIAARNFVLLSFRLFTFLVENYYIRYSSSHMSIKFFKRNISSSFSRDIDGMLLSKRTP